MGGGCHVDMVSRWYLPTNAPYMPGHVVDYRRDNNPIESYVVYSPYVELVERGCLGLSCYDPRPP